MIPELGPAGKDAFALLLHTAEFSGPTVGAIGITPDSVYAFRVLLSEPSSLEVFRILVQEASLAGQLYGLAGLYLLDELAFQSAHERFQHRREPVMTHAGCSEAEERLEDVALEIAHGELPRLLAGKRNTEPDWRNRRTQTAGELALELISFDKVLASQVPRLMQIRPSTASDPLWDELLASLQRPNPRLEQILESGETGLSLTVAQGLKETVTIWDKFSEERPLAFKMDLRAPSRMALAATRRFVDHLRTVVRYALDALEPFVESSVRDRIHYHIVSNPRASRVINPEC